MTLATFQLDRAATGTLGVIGALTFETAAEALQAITVALAGSPITELDLAGVQRSDSAGLACILAVQAAAVRHGRTLRVRHLPEGMRALARVCDVEALVG